MMNSAGGGSGSGDAGWEGGQGQGHQQQQQQHQELEQLRYQHQQLILQQQLRLQLQLHQQQQQQQQQEPRPQPQPQLRPQHFGITGHGGGGGDFSEPRPLQMYSNSTSSISTMHAGYSGSSATIPTGILGANNNISSSSSSINDGLFMNAGGGAAATTAPIASDGNSNRSSFLGCFFPPQQQQQQQQQQRPSSIHPSPVTVQSGGYGDWSTSSNQQESMYEPRPLLNDLKRRNATSNGTAMAIPGTTVTSGMFDRTIGSGSRGIVTGSSSVGRKRTNRNESKKSKNKSACGDHNAERLKGTQMETINNLTDDLNQLSFEQRRQIMEEIHGVDKIDMPVETPQFVKQKLDELQKALSKLNPRRQRKHYDRAVFLKPSLVDDVPFKLMFLRATRYDATKAAISMASYFTNKVELFGMSKIVQRITVHDLSPEDKATFETNATRALPRKDSVGRLVFWSILPEFRGTDWKNLARGYWYELMRNIQDDDQVQLNGGVKVFFFYPLNDTDEDGNEVPYKGPNLLDPAFAEIASKCGPILNNLPIRYTGVHMCYNNVQLNPLINIIHVLIGREYRLRFRAHEGSRMESQYALLQFGIPLEVAPMFEKMSDFRAYNHRYLEERQSIESPERRLRGGNGSDNQRQEKTTTNSAEIQNQGMVDLDPNGGNATASPSPSPTSDTGIILYPSEYDVLLGRGRPYQDFSGNQYLTKLVDVIRHCYTETNDRHEKRYLGMSVMAQIESKGGRFLKRAESASSPQSGDKEEDREQNENKGSDVARTSMTTAVPTTTVVKGWQVVSSDTALDKILHAFRTKKNVVSSSNDFHTSAPPAPTTTSSNSTIL